MLRSIGSGPQMVTPNVSTEKTRLGRGDDTVSGIGKRSRVAVIGRLQPLQGAASSQTRVAPSLRMIPRTLPPKLLRPGTRLWRADSDAFRPLIPTQSVHRFRRISSTRFCAVMAASPGTGSEGSSGWGGVLDDLM